MDFKLVIFHTKEDSNEETREFVFNGVRSVHIGRGKSNDITLADPGRTVSRNHARIFASDDGYVVEDLESKNFTFVNSERVSNGTQRVLQDGDVIKIGDYNLDYKVVEVSDQLEETVFGDSVMEQHNPFVEAVEELYQSFTRLSEVYKREGERNRTHRLAYALKNSLPPEEVHEVLKLFIEVLEEDEEFPLREAYVHETLLGVDDEEAQPKKIGRAAQRSFDTVVNSLKTLVEIPESFQTDFIDSDVQVSTSKPLTDRDYKEIKSYLMDPSANLTAAMKQRLERLKTATANTVEHQRGMIEGYRAVVKSTMQMVLREIDPAPLERHVLASKALYKVFPSLGSKEVLNGVKKNLAHMQQSDWNVLEQRVYRPIFIRAYLVATGLSISLEEAAEDKNEKKSDKKVKKEKK